MSSEQLADGVNPLDAELAATWDVLKGYSGRDTDLGIARRFGGSAAAYSLRDIGAMNGSVVRVRREPNDTTASIDDEENFSANQVQSGALEDWVNGKLESKLPADVATAAAAYSLRKVRADYANNAVRIRRSSDDAEVNVAFDLDDKVSTSSSISVVSGTVTDTTLGDFISGTDAFVHTWYDQAGSNNAIQETDTNQPKIAENGALLADGIDFDGSNDSLNITNSLPITGANARSVFVVVNKDVSSSSDNILGIGDNGSGVNSQLWNLATTYGLYYNGGNTVFGSGTLNTNQLVTAIYPSSASDSGDTVLFINSASSSITSNVDTTLATDNTVARIGSGGGSAGGNLDGSLQELVIYATDQSNNRFKIESNINNYYGLYNDEYEWDDATNTEWQNNVTDGTTTFTANGKDGFTITATGNNISNFKYAITSPSTASDDYYKVSFNVNDPDGLFTNAQLRATATGAGATSQTIGNGFNELSLRTGSSFEYMTINSNGGGSSKTATLSDFKISRIARNGFVETWYDQSGNGRDMIQATADNQPSIVSNGGYMNGVYSEPASNSTTSGNKQYMRITGTNSLACNDFTTTKVGMVAIVNSLLPSTASGITISTVLGNIRGVQSFPTGALGLQIAGTTSMEFTNYTATNAENKDSSSSTRTVGENVLVGGTMDNRNVKTFTFTEQGSDTDTTTASTDIVLTSQKDFGIFYSTFANDSGGEDLNVTRTAGGYMKEAYILDGDIIDDIDSINLELRQHYNLA